MDGRRARPLPARLPGQGAFTKGYLQQLPHRENAQAVAAVPEEVTLAKTTFFIGKFWYCFLFFFEKLFVSMFDATYLMAFMAYYIGRGSILSYFFLIFIFLLPIQSWVKLFCSTLFLSANT